MDLIKSSRRPTLTAEVENVTFEELESFFALHPETESQVSMKESQPGSSTLPVIRNQTKPTKQQVSPEMQKSLQNSRRHKQYRERVKDKFKKLEQRVLELTSKLQEKDLQLQQLKHAQNQSLKIRAITTTVTVKCSCSRMLFSDAFFINHT